MVNFTNRLFVVYFYIYNNGNIKSTYILVYKLNISETNKGSSNNSNTDIFLLFLFKKTCLISYVLKQF